MKQIKNITIGSDPEFFIFSELENKFISPIGMYKGTKHNPLPITENGHFIQVDGSSCEFNIPPCNTSEKFSKEISFILNLCDQTG